MANPKARPGSKSAPPVALTFRLGRAVQRARQMKAEGDLAQRGYLHGLQVALDASLDMAGAYYDAADLADDVEARRIALAKAAAAKALAGQIDALFAAVGREIGVRPRRMDRKAPAREVARG